MDIVLASKSPRRRELLARVRPGFRVFPVNVDESSVREKDPAKFAVEAAVLKAKTAADSFQEAVVIGADTVVSLGRRILGKPSDRDSARAMLKLLSGLRHRVITGLAFYRKAEDRLLTGYEVTYVTFRPLSDQAIEAYLDRDDFRDKAGAYAVQDVGDTFVRRIKGDYDNVVGLPVKKAAALLDRFEAAALTLVIEDQDFPGSSGMAKAGGRTILVPGAVLGDKVKAQVVGESRGVLRGQVIHFESLSPWRAEPRCRHFGTCGGCLFQNLDYGRQLELKHRHLERTLGGGSVPGLRPGAIQPVAPSPDVYHYRNKMEFAFAESWGELVIGLRERGDPSRKARGRTVGLSTCPIFGPDVERLFEVVFEHAGRHGLTPHNPRTGRGLLRHLVLREGRRTGDLMIVLVTAPGAGPGFEALAGRLKAEFPQLKSFYHVVNRRNSDVVSFEEMRLVLGSPWIAERLCGLTFRVYPQAFFQTNTAAAEALYRKIAELAGLTAGKSVMGLYCGSGAIELSLARAAAKVTGVDSLPENIRSAEENAVLNGIANATFITGTVEDCLRDPVGGPPDVVVLDPPRAGLTSKAMKRVLALDVPKVVYVSCSPRALVRDLKIFAAGGYTAETILPFDFFPHTPHLETLAVLSI
jgi:23S rRNA (uracil1939-C5)-methyltransferase